MNSPKVSVIIPVYNVENYIKKCLDTIVNQTYNNLQVILVDDGSKDSSGNVCEEYASKYDIFEVHHKKNEGLALTRNYGMQYIKGKYFAFVDADDWLDENYFDECVKYLENTNADIAIVPFIKEYVGNSVTNNLFDFKNKLFNKQETKKLLRRLVGELGPEMRHPGRIEDYNTAWAKMYRSSKFSNVKSEDGKRSEDLLFNLNCFLLADSIVYLSSTYYHYNRQNDNSIVSNINYQLIDQFKALYSTISDMIKKNNLGIEYQEALNNRIILNLLTVAINYAGNGQIKLVERLHILKRALSDDLYLQAFKTFDFSYLPKSYKIFYGLCKYKMVLPLYFMTNLAMKKRDKIKR